MRAEILCDASGVKLGELINIDYNWGEINFYSSTSYMLSESANYDASPMHFNPDDIRIKDSVTFIWEIL